MTTHDAFPHGVDVGCADVLRRSHSQEVVHPPNVVLMADRDRMRLPKAKTSREYLAHGIMERVLRHYRSRNDYVFGHCRYQIGYERRGSSLSRQLDFSCGMPLIGFLKVHRIGCGGYGKNPVRGHISGDEYSGRLGVGHVGCLRLFLHYS